MEPILGARSEYVVEVFDVYGTFDCMVDMQCTGSVHGLHEHPCVFEVG